MGHDRLELTIAQDLERASDAELRDTALAHWATAAGDRAFGVLWNRYEPRVKSRVRSCVGKMRGLDAQELFSDVQLKVAEAVRTGKSAADWPAYVSTIVGYAAVDQTRRKSRRLKTVDLPPALDGGPELDLETLAARSAPSPGFRPLNEVLRKVVVQEALARVARRHPRWARVVELLYLEERSLQEAAEELEMSTKQIGRDRNDCLNMLERLLSGPRTAP